MIDVPECQHFVYTAAERDGTAGYQVTAKSPGIDGAVLAFMDGYLYPANMNPATFTESRSLLVAKDKIAYSMMRNAGVGYDGRDGTLYNHTLVMDMRDFSRIDHDTRVLEKYFVRDCSVQGGLEPIDVPEQTLKPDFDYLKNLDPDFLGITLHGIVRNANMAIGASDLEIIPNVLSMVPKHARLRSFSTYVVQPERQPKYRIIQMPRVEESRIPPKYRIIQMPRVASGTPPGRARANGHVAPNARRAASANMEVQETIRILHGGPEAEMGRLLDYLDGKLSTLVPKARQDAKDEDSSQTLQPFDVLQDVLAAHEAMDELVDLAARGRHGTENKNGAGRLSRKTQAMRERVRRAHKSIGRALRSNIPAMEKSNKKFLKKTLQALDDRRRRVERHASRTPRCVAQDPFSLNPHDLERLSPHDCAQLFGDLLYCDAKRLGVPISEIRFTSKTMPDGGIDASVGRVASPGCVLHGNHFYQIKAGENFLPWQKNQIKKELLKGVTLKPEIRRCFRENGTYVLVCAQKQMTVQQINKSAECVRSVAESCGVKDPSVKVWGQDLVMRAASLFPSVLLRFRDLGRVKTHGQWSDGQSLVYDKKQDERITEIRADIRSNYKHVDVCGDIGTGKTRIVLEATRSPDLSPLVAYCPSPDDLSAALESYIVKGDLACILIVDGCDQAGKLEMAARVRTAASVQLITISAECRGFAEDARQVEAPALDAETIKKIIERYGIDNITAQRLSGWCEGIPMMAHVFGRALKSGSDPLHGIQDIYQVFDRYIGLGDPGPVRLDQRRRILYTISLFQKFGNSRRFKEELDAVCKIARTMDGSITDAIFQEHLSELRDLGILRGKTTLSLRLRPLHVWMWTQWWKQHADTFDIKILQDLPQSLRDGFIRMFMHAGSSSDAVRVLADLFEGPLREPRHLATSPGSDLFAYWAAADPKAALRHLERVLQSEAGLSEATCYQRTDPEGPGWGQPRPYRNIGGIVRGLETIAFNKDLFARAARTLARLAEASESQSAAADLLVSLFAPGIEYMSETEAPPSARLPALKEMLCSEKPALRNLGFRACAAALSMPDSRLVHPGNDFVPEAPGWVPETWGELEEAYRAVIGAMLESMDGLSDADSKECALIIAQRAVDVTGRVPGIAGYVAESLSHVKNIVEKEKMIKSITDVVEIRGKTMSLKDRNKFEKLLSDLTGASYADRLDTFACMEITIDGTADPEKTRMRELEALAAESDAEKLGPELPWLVTKRAKCGGMFGVALAERDAGFALLRRILEAQRAAGPGGDSSFLCGYMSVVCEKDRALWRQTVDLVSKDEKTAHVTGHLYRWSGCLDDDGGRHLLDLARSGKIGADSLALFVWGSAHRRLSDKIVMQWIEHMSGTGDPNAVSGALHIFRSRFAQGRTKLAHPKIAVNLLLHDAFLDEKSSALRDPLLGTCWADVATKLKDDAECSIVFASAILGRMDEWMAKCHPYVVPALDAIGAAMPDDLWDVVAKHVTVPLDNKSQAIFAWMRAVDSSGDFLDGVDFERIRTWIDGNPAGLAPLVARWVRPAMSRNSIARNILYRYGSDPKVREALSSNFFTGRFSGPESLYLEARKKELEDCTNPDDGENVAEWLDSMIDVIDERIARAKTAEERGPHG